MQVAIRSSNEHDLNFIYSTWLRGLYYGNDFYKEIQKEAFFHFYPGIIERLLSNSIINIICLTDEPDTIIGYSVVSADRIHFVYIKEAFRKQGLSKKLLPGTYTSVSHVTRAGNAIRKKKKWAFNPF